MVSWMEGVVVKAEKVYTDGKKEPSIIISSISESSSSGFPQMTKSGSNLFFARTDEKDKAIKVARLLLKLFNVSEIRIKHYTEIEKWFFRNH